MSWSPCCQCRRSDQGRLYYAYLSTFRGDERLSFRLRLCEGCWADLVPQFTEIADRDYGDGKWLTQDQRAQDVVSSPQPPTPLPAGRRRGSSALSAAGPSTAAAPAAR